MNRVKLIVAEAVRSLGANVSTTFAATTTVLIGMFMLGLVVGLGSWALSLSDHYKKQLLVKVYFCTRLTCGTEATTADKDTVHNQLIAMPQVKSLHYISREQAYQIALKTIGPKVKDAPGNPFPDSYDVIPKSGDQVETIARQLNPTPSGVQRICPPAPGTNAAKTSTGEKCGGIAHRVITVANYLWVVVLIAFIVLLVSSTLLIANTRRDELVHPWAVHDRGTARWARRSDRGDHLALTRADALPRARHSPARGRRPRVAVRAARADRPRRGAPARRCRLRPHDPPFPPGLSPS